MAEESLDGVHSRRNSLAGADSASSRDKTLPRYLRASTGSCHDLCKYGKKHDSDENTKRPWKRNLKKPCDEPSLFRSLDLQQRKKTSATESKSFPNSRSRTPDMHEVIELQSSTCSPSGNNSRIHDVLLKSRLSDAPKVMQKGGLSSSKKLGISSKEVSSKAKEKRFSKTKSQPEKLPSASLPSKVSSVKRSNGINDTRMGKTTPTSKVAATKALASRRVSSSPRATSLTARQNRNLKVVPLQKNQIKVETAETEQPLDEQDVCNNDSLEEKTLYVIKMETENILLESDKNENCASELSPHVASSPKSSTISMSPPYEDESEYTDDESDSENCEDDEDETVNTGEVELSEQENGGRTRKGRMVSSDEKDCLPVKLSFRRGKIVDIQSESNSPRRLKFRRARLLGGNQNVKAAAERRTFRTREVDGDMNDKYNNPGEEKVVLRHQGMQGKKKDEKVLFNNVIEETASKLVETRKSKVKALVGAFETVIISLQDGQTLSEHRHLSCE